MAVFKCKMCGGDLNVTEGVSVYECEYCGTKQTVAGADNEKKLNLYNRANRLRISGEFDKATVIYESIVAEFPEEAEAYWGLVICNYGIEYVDDPATAKKIPTCHRASFESIQNDENYKLALEYADVSAQKIYRDEAREIDRIREEILSISKNEKPYDIFICYKETDDKGERTIDSVIAQDLYDVLNAKGYKVFFSRISLEDKLGRHYEPYIFAALNSAKVMLSVGTKYEHFHAVWVKNEWSRFLKLMAKDKSKVLIPCFKDIDAYDLPEEFKALQAQDLGKVGAVQDLLRGIDKILPENKVNKEIKLQEFSIKPNVSVLLERVAIFLEDGDWDRADDFCEQILNIDPRNAEAYLGKLLAELEVKTKEELKNISRSFGSLNNYQKVMRFGNDELKNELQEYVYFVENRFLILDYNDAIEIMQAANSEAEYKNAANKFRKIAEFRDSKELAEKCEKLSEEVSLHEKYSEATSFMNSAKTSQEYMQAFDMFNIISGYKDSKELAEICLERAENLLESARKIRRERYSCQHCGGKFKGFLIERCALCGKIKDY